MRLFIGILIVAFTLLSCTSNRYVLSDSNNDKDFLKEEIKKLKKTEGISNTPLLVIDGVPYRYDIELKEKPLNFSKSDIEKISVLKREPATKIYGDSAKDGVILITLKKIEDNSLDKEAKELAELVKNGKALFFVNGIETSLEDVMKIDPNSVEELTILKDEAAKKMFPDRNLDGIIYIKTKNR